MATVISPETPECALHVANHPYQARGSSAAPLWTLPTPARRRSTHPHGSSACPWYAAEVGVELVRAEAGPLFARVQECDVGTAPP